MHGVKRPVQGYFAAEALHTLHMPRAVQREHALALDNKLTLIADKRSVRGHPNNE